MQYRYEIVWLAQQLEKQKVSSEPSLWNALRYAQFKQMTETEQRKRQVYITGEPQVLFEMTNLCDSIAMLQNVITFKDDKYTHPALQWMNITYYPPNRLDQLDNHQTVSLFVDNRLPLWSRSLFMDNKVCNVVGIEDIPSVQCFPNVTFYKAEIFSYMHLLDDVIVKKEKEFVRPKQQLLPEVPKQYALKLATTTNSNELIAILDEAAASMLNIYWLQNHPPLPQWMPILLREIGEYLFIQKNIVAKGNVLDKLKVWGNRDKRIS